jgi:hypothetical protein
MRYHRNPYHRRRNGDVGALIALVEQMGQARLALLMRKFQSDPEVAPMLAEIADLALAIVAEAQAEAPAPAGISDSQGWSMLADLVPTALSNLSPEYQSALIAVFREEAAKAA